MDEFEKKFIRKLFQEKYRGQRVHLCKNQIQRFALDILGILFPQLGNRSFDSERALGDAIQQVKRELAGILGCLSRDGATLPLSHEEVAERLFKVLPEIEGKLVRDAQFIYEEDPAAKSVDEVILCYPGFFAIATYRLAHEFHRMDLPLFPRVLTEFAHERTGVDIHPAARIGCPLFIDHGTGIVIGETTRIGDHVKIYQGVTLGALSISPEMRNRKRHPTIEDRCIIYANTTILGGETVVGAGSVIGGNVWLIESVPPDSRLFYRASQDIRTPGQGTRS